MVHIPTVGGHPRAPQNSVVPTYYFAKTLGVVGEGGTRVPGIVSPPGTPTNHRPWPERMRKRPERMFG